MNSRSALSAIVFFVLIGGTAFAFDCRPEEVSSLSPDIFQCLSQRWTEKLGSGDDSLNEKAGELFKNTVFQGLQKLEALNPNLYQHTTNEISGRKLTITGPGTSTQFVAYETNLWNLFGGPQIELEPEGYLLLQSYFRSENSGTADELTGAALRNLLFHEFLHFANIPIDPSKHNDSNAANFGDHYRETDLVFSCAAQAFPFEPLFSEIVRGKTGGLDLLIHRNTHRSCMTCASARFGLRGEMIAPSLSDLKSAEMNCASIKDSDFVETVHVTSSN